MHAGTGANGVLCWGWAGLFFGGHLVSARPTDRPHEAPSIWHHFWHDLNGQVQNAHSPSRTSCTSRRNMPPIGATTTDHVTGSSHTALPLTSPRATTRTLTRSWPTTSSSISRTRRARRRNWLRLPSSETLRLGGRCCADNTPRCGTHACALPVHTDSFLYLRRRDSPPKPNETTFLKPLSSAVLCSFFSHLCCYRQNRPHL